jgi:hypothetical protein
VQVATRKNRYSQIIEKYALSDEQALLAKIRYNRLVEFELSGIDIAIVDEKHYRLVRPDELSDEELEKYKMRSY